MTTNNPGGIQINFPFTTTWITIPIAAPAEEIGTPDQDLAVPVEKKKINKDGCRCRKCKEFYPYAQANQEDGTLICYSCRKGW